MDTTRKLMQFYFIANAETATHYHQNPEMFYVLRGNLDIKIDDKTYKEINLSSLYKILEELRINDNL